MRKVIQETSTIIYECTLHLKKHFLTVAETLGLHSTMTYFQSERHSQNTDLAEKAFAFNSSMDYDFKKIRCVNKPIPGIG